MAHREQRSNREKRKPKKDKMKAVSVASPFSSVKPRRRLIKAAREKVRAGLDQRPCSLVVQPAVSRTASSVDLLKKPSLAAGLRKVLRTTRGGGKLRRVLGFARS